MTVSSDSDSFPLQDSIGKPANRAGSAGARRLPTVSAKQAASGSSQPSSSPAAAPEVTSDPSFSIDIEPLLEDDTLGTRIRRTKNPLAAFLSSTLLHAFWILLLLFFSWKSPPTKVISLVASMESVEVNAEIADPNEAINETLETFESPLEDTHEDTSDEPEKMAESEIELVEPVVDVVAVLPTAPSETTAEAELSGAEVIVVGGSLAGRAADSRAGLAAARGGSPESEKAVERALRWIIEHQDPYDGGWKFQLRCGQCDDSGLCKSRNAATGLALMALLGAGYTHEAGPYQEQVDYGLKFLVKRQKLTPEYGGSFIDIGSKGMYYHAIATIALAEAFAMTGDDQLRKPLVEAQRYIVVAQNKRGGWRYAPGNAGDVLVTGWQIMALKALDQAGIATPLSVYERADTFLVSCRDDYGKFKYLPRNPKAEPSPTAVALLSRMYMGMPQNDRDLQRGCSYLHGRGINKTDVYFDFYTTLTLHHAQHESWEDWNEQMRDYLVKTQEIGGHQAGSWHFNDEHGSGVVGGRLYTTAMAAMTLEVYYRYSPLFAATAEDSQ